VPGELRARISLFAGLDPAAARDAEWGLRAVEAGPAADALWPEGEPLLSIAPRELVLSALKPAAQGDDAIVIRVLNPTSGPLDAELSLALPFANAASRVSTNRRSTARPRAAERRCAPVAPHALRSLRVELRRTS